MIKSLIVLFLCTGCYGRDAWQETKTTAVIVGVSDRVGSAPRTFVFDEHGHKGDIYGIWGDKGETINIICIKYKNEFHSMRLQ
jgi:hypothetical protein